MIHSCNQCQAATKVDITFDYQQVVCASCRKISNSNHNFKTMVRKESIVLALNQKGELFGTEYTVIGIVVKKHGALFFWREYYLRGRNNEVAFLSEADGHWIFLKRCDAKTEYKAKVAIYKGDTFRWYADTSCHIVHAVGFFEKNLITETHRIYEYILEERILSSDDQDEYIGEHVSGNQIKRAFGISKMPKRSGIGLVQPYYFKIKESAILLSLFLFVFIAIHIVVVSSRTNLKVYSGVVDTFDSAFEDVVTESFSLKGGVAPLYVEAHADLSNNWVNVEVALVNEKTNEVLVANRDIEYYQGVDGGERWAEGSTNAKFNFCSIPQGDYHLVVRASNGFTPPEGEYTDSLIQIDSKIKATLRPNGFIVIEDFRYSELLTDSSHISEQRQDYYFNEAKSYFLATDKEAAALALGKKNSRSLQISNKVHIHVTWKPNNFWNLIICVGVLIVIFILIALGKIWFENKKWANSTNTPK